MKSTTVDKMFKIFSYIFFAVFCFYLVFIPLYIFGAIGSCELGLISVSEMCTRMGYSVIMSICAIASLLIGRAFN